MLTTFAAVVRTVRRLVVRVLCRHDIRLVPDLALFSNQRWNLFPARCRVCGQVRWATGAQIKEAHNSIIDMTSVTSTKPTSPADA